jgi:hypothetical protein
LLGIAPMILHNIRLERKQELKFFSESLLFNVPKINMLVAVLLGKLCQVNPKVITLVLFVFKPNASDTISIAELENVLF